MKEHKRAARRYRRDRIKKKRSEDLKHRLADLSSVEKSIQIKKSIDTPAPCSCFMCGNPRKYFGEISHQEQRANEAQRDQLSYSLS